MSRGAFLPAAGSGGPKSRCWGAALKTPYLKIFQRKIVCVGISCCGGLKKPC